MYISLLHVALNSCLCSYAYSFFYLLTLGKYNFLFLRVSRAWISFEGNFTFFAKRAFASGRSKALRQSKSLPSFSTTFAHLSETRVACHDDGVFIFRIDPPINYFFPFLRRLWSAYLPVRAVLTGKGGSPMESGLENTRSVGRLSILTPTIFVSRNNVVRCGAWSCIAMQENN